MAEDFLPFDAPRTEDAHYHECHECGRTYVCDCDTPDAEDESCICNVCAHTADD